MRVQWGLCCLLLALSGCGKKGSDYTYRWSYDTGDRGYLDPVAEARKLVDQSRVECAESKQCNPSTALLSFSKSSEVGMCTAFVISPSLLMTNSHCVEKNPEYIKVFFPETFGFKAETREASIVHYSAIDSSTQAKLGKRADYATLRLSQSTSRPALKVDTSGVPDETQLRIVSMTPQSRTRIQVKLIEQQCESVMNSAIQPTYTTPFAAVIAITGCLVDHGNSGSPLIDSNGMVRAIAHAAIDQKANERIRRELDVEAMDPLGMATNMACVVTLRRDGSVPSECTSTIVDADLIDGLQIMKERAAKDPNAQIRLTVQAASEAKKWKSSHPTELRWKSTYNGSEFTVKPECVLKTAKSETEITEYLPTWKVYSHVDSKLRVEAALQEGFWSAYSIRYKSSGLKSSASIQVLMAKLQYTSDNVWADLNLGYCRLRD